MRGAGGGRYRAGAPAVLVVCALAAYLGGGTTARAEGACGPVGSGLDAGDVSYSLSIDAERDADGTEVAAAFRLVMAREAQDVAMLLFADGIQILGPDPVLTADCSETLRWRTRVRHEPGGPLDLHASPQLSPGLPEPFHDPSGTIPDNTGALKHAYDAADVATVAFGPPRDPPEGSASRRAEIVPAPMADAYLFDDEPGEPVHVRALEPRQERWRFRIWFGETLRRGGHFGITCLLDDRQFAAFEGRPLWFGHVDRGEAALIPARTPPLEPGWHQVRCLVLDSLFAGEERGVAWPYVIRSTFVYRRP